MPNWLAKASGAIPRESDATPQEFRLTCECGQLHQGQRKSKSQRIICQTCGAALFVLPRNVYPVLRPPKSKRRKKGAAKRRRDEPWFRGVGRGTSAAARSAQQSLRSTSRAVGQPVQKGAIAVGTFVRAQMTPFRLVIFGIGLMLIATGAWAVHRRSLEEARESLRREFAAGMDSLTSDDAVAAQGHFAAAALAVDDLRSTDARSQQALQMLHETTALTRLAPQSLFEMLEEAEDYDTPQQQGRWDDRFRATYTDTWLVMEAPIHRLSASEGDAEGPGETSIVIDFPLVVGEQGRTVRVIAHVPDRTSEGLSTEPQNAIFAASLADCRLDEEANRWVVTLSSETGFLWSDADNLQRLGFFETAWPSKEETRALLKDQTERLELP